MNNTRYILLLILAAMTLIALPVANASYYYAPTHGQRYWYDSYEYNSYNYGHTNQHNSYRYQAPTYYRQPEYVHYPTRHFVVNQHHTQALCQQQCGTSNNRPYIVITNHNGYGSHTTTRTIVHHQHRVVQTPPPPAIHTFATTHYVTY